MPLPPESDDLIRRAAQIDRIIVELTEGWRREVGRIWRVIERELAGELTPTSTPGRAASVANRSARLRRRMRSIMEHAGYDDAIIVAVDETANRFLGTMRLTRKRLDFLHDKIIALGQITAEDLLGHGDETAHVLWRAISQHVLAGSDVREIVASLAPALDRTSAQAETLFQTETAVFSRRLELLQPGVNDDEQAFLYLGPVDNRTRPFCLQYVGKVLTKREIAKLDNRQLPNVLLTGGGYNCRHSWMAVESDEAKALADSDVRIDPVAEDVERVQGQPVGAGVRN